MATSEETDGGISAAPNGAIVGREKDVGQMEAPGSTKNAGAAAENGNLATSEDTLAGNGHAALDLKMDEPENDVEGDDEGEDDDDDDDDDEDGEDEDDEEDPAQNLRRLVADDDDEDDDDEDEFEPGEVDDDEDDDIDDEVDESFDVGQEQAQGSSGVKRTADESLEDESRAKKARTAEQQPTKSAGTAVEKKQQVPKPPSKVDSLLSSLTKKQPTTTVLDASRRNWQSMKEQNPNLKEDVEEHLKSKDSYLSKQAFLNRDTDQPASTGTAAALGPRRPK